MTLDEFLSRLHNVHGHSAQCPAHDDHANSLSVSTGKDGRIVVKCHAGCSAEDICAALGLKLSDLFAEPLPHSAAPPAKRTLSAQYDYYDLNGAFLYRKTRWVDENGKKSFTWSRRDSADKWQSGRGGAKPVLYNVQATQESDRIYLVEGEKDVETMRFLALPAVSTPDGAASSWEPQFTEALAGHAVTIIQDNDEPGKAFAQRAARALYGKAACVKVLDLTAEWANLKAHGDVTDVYEAEPGGAESFLPAFSLWKRSRLNTYRLMKRRKRNRLKKTPLSSIASAHWMISRKRKHPGSFPDGSQRGKSRCLRQTAAPERQRSGAASSRQSAAGAPVCSTRQI